MPTTKPRRDALGNARGDGNSLPIEIGSLPVLDTRILRDLEKELAPPVVREYLRTFLSQATGRLEEIRLLAVAGEANRVAYLSHDMVSTAGNIGALQMSTAARALARSCRNDDHHRARRYLDDLALSTYATCLEIQKWLMANDDPAPYSGPERRGRETRKIPKERRRPA